MALAKELKIKAKNISLLYAEDDPKIRKGMTDFLKRFFQDIHVAENGQEGLAAFKKRRYDMVVTDIKMPKLNGLSMAKEIKKLRKETKIIVTSAFDDKNLLLNAIENSIDHYIVKPIDFSALVIMLYKTVALIKLEKRIEQLNRHKQAILDAQADMICTIKEGRITSANKKFLDFFNLKSLKAIVDNKISLADFIIKEDGYFYPVDKTEWAGEIQEATVYDMLIKLRDARRNEAHTFILKIGTLQDFDETIVTLSNISGYVEGRLGSRETDQKCYFFDQEGIPNYLSFLKNEINRSRKYSLPLTVIQFVVELPDEQYDTVDKVVGKELKLVDFFAKPTQKKYIITKINTELGTAHQLAKKILGVLQKKFSAVDGFRCYFGIAGLAHNDDVQEFISRAESLTQSAKESGGFEMKTDFYSVETPGSQRQEKKLIFDKLSARAREKKAVKVISFYNGMKVSDEATVTYVGSNEEKVLLKLAKKQYGTLKNGDVIFLSIDDYFADVETSVDIDCPQPHCIGIDKPVFARESSPLKRENLRVGVEDGLEIKLHDLHGKIVDISVKSLACEMTDIRDLLLGKVIGAEFLLPVENRNEKITLNAEVYKIEREGLNYRVVLLLLADNKARNMITTYISKREHKIIKEIAEIGKG